MILIVLLLLSHPFGLFPMVSMTVRAAKSNEILHVQKMQNKRSVYRVIQVHLIHRHGDRSPITPMKDKSFWSSEIIPHGWLEKLDAKTQIIRHKKNEDEKNQQHHLAAGRGPFGQLTRLGLFQMVELGATLREQLIEEKVESKAEKSGMNSNNKSNHIIQKLFHEVNNPLYPSKIQVWSTDFPRTIQSIQGTLTGLLPDEDNTIINVDARHTSIMIPDPQPRNSQEQTDLEYRLSQREHILEREHELQTLKEEISSKLEKFIDENEAFGISFGIGEEKKNMEKAKSQQKMLSWTQLTEIMVCLRARNLLPEDITPDMQRTLSEFCAWKWFSVLRDDRLAYLAMHPFCDNIVQSMRECLEVQNRKDNKTTRKQLYLYSAHDSTLIGLLCGFHIEKPKNWPEYGSYIKVELLQKVGDSKNKLMVRFSLNDEILKSQWTNCNDEMISLDQLTQNLSSCGSAPSSK